MKLLSTYGVNPSGRCLGRSRRSWGLVQGLHSLYENAAVSICDGHVCGEVQIEEFIPEGEPSGVSLEGRGPTARIF